MCVWLKWRPALFLYLSFAPFSRPYHPSSPFYYQTMPIFHLRHRSSPYLSSWSCPRWWCVSECVSDECERQELARAHHEKSRTSTSLSQAARGIAAEPPNLGCAARRAPQSSDALDVGRVTRWGARFSRRHRPGDPTVTGLRVGGGDQALASRAATWGPPQACREDADHVLPSAS